MIPDPFSGSNPQGDVQTTPSEQTTGSEHPALPIGLIAAGMGALLLVWYLAKRK